MVLNLQNEEKNKEEVSVVNILKVLEGMLTAD